MPQNMIACQVDDKQQNYELQEAGFDFWGRHRSEKCKAFYKRAFSHLKEGANAAAGT